MKVSTTDNPSAYMTADKIFSGEEDGTECIDTDYDKYKITWNDHSNKNVEWKYMPN